MMRCRSEAVLINYESERIIITTDFILFSTFPIHIKHINSAVRATHTVIQSRPKLNFLLRGREKRRSSGHLMILEYFALKIVIPIC